LGCLGGVRFATDERASQESVVEAESWTGRNPMGDLCRLVSE